MTQPPATSPSSGLLGLNTKPLDFAARAYASMGWPVLPLIPREKRPLNEGGLSNASTDLDQIDEWWTKWPRANVALRTGDAFDVLDLDSTEATDTLHRLIALKQLEEGVTVAKYRHDGPIASTGKGFHLLFEPTGARNFANRYPGIDFRGQRGYIVASPSIHPNGHQYRWVRDEVLPEPTSWLLDMLTPTRVTAPNSQYAPEDLAPVTQVWNETYGAHPDHQLAPLGARFITRCPWHDDSTPSLVLYPENNSFYCFGCESWGDTLDVGDTFKGGHESPAVMREATRRSHID